MIKSNFLYKNIKVNTEKIMQLDLRHYLFKSVFFLLIFVSFPSHSLDSSEVSAWSEDIDNYAEQIVNLHIDPFHSISRKGFYTKLADLKKSLPTKTTEEVLVELMRLTHSFNDGHTSLPLWKREFHYFPFSLKVFDGDVYIVETTNQYKYLLGAKIVSINKVSTADILEYLAEITPFSENEYSSAVRAAEYMIKAEILNGIGVISSVNGTSFELNLNGQLRKLHIETSENPVLNFRLSLGGNSSFNVEEKISDDVWFGSSKDKKTIYVKFRRYPSFRDMDSLGEDILSFIKYNRSKNIVIDLRDNYGGDFFVGLKLAHLLLLADSINWKSGVYVLINNVTFSAAMSNAAQFQQVLNAKLVGEPTGSKPNGYQDMGTFTLPNSDLEVTYSKRLYRFKDDKQNALYPDVDIRLSIRDYIKKEDRQLLWVLNDIATK